MTRRAPAIVIGVIIAAAVALGGVAVPLTNHPKFCASCHTIQPSHDSWVQSSHKEVECISCHVRPGVEGWVHDKAWNGTRDVAITSSAILRRPTIFAHMSIQPCASAVTGISYACLKFRSATFPLR